MRPSTCDLREALQLERTRCHLAFAAALHPERCPCHTQVERRKSFSPLAGRTCDPRPATCGEARNDVPPSLPLKRQAALQPGRTCCRLAFTAAFYPERCPCHPASRKSQVLFDSGRPFRASFATCGEARNDVPPSLPLKRQPPPPLRTALKTLAFLPVPCENYRLRSASGLFCLFLMRYS